MPQTTFHTTYSSNPYLFTRTENGSESGLRGVVSYRFGFNGQEMDNEITGQTGTHTTAMFWEYDSRLGRRWNLDPVVKSWASPYETFSCSPISLIDPNGDADYYSATGRWLGNDGHYNNDMYVIKDKSIKREIKKASRHGLFYTNDIKTNRKILKIPQKRTRILALSQFNETKMNGYETGGHSYIGDDPTSWDHGPKIKRDGDYFVGKLAMFQVNGEVVPTYVSELEFVWHCHMDNPQEESSSDVIYRGPSDGYTNAEGLWVPGDIPNAGDMKISGYKGDLFVIDGSYVYYYDEQGKRGAIMIDSFKTMGDIKKGSLYKSFLKRGKISKDIYDIIPNKDNNKV